LDDFSAYIPTNLMSMTDGHLLFDAAIYHQGTRPAIDISLSVSRVGKQTQTLPQKMLADRVRTVLAEAEKLETLSRFGSEVSSQTQLLLKQSEQIKTLLTQPALSKIPTVVQMVLMGLTFTPFFQTKEITFIEKNKKAIIDYLSSSSVLNQVQQQVNGFQNDSQLLEYVKQITPTLEKLCQPSGN